MSEKWVAWAGQGWPRAWARFTGISDQEVVWPVRLKNETGEDSPLAVAATPEIQMSIVLGHEILAGEVCVHCGEEFQEGEATVTFRSGLLAHCLCDF